MLEWSDEEWIRTMHLTCLIVGEFAIAVSNTVDYDPETLQEAEQAVVEAREGVAHAENGAKVVSHLLAGKVTARSDEAFSMLAIMLDITEWHYSYMTRHVTPTEDLKEKYRIAKEMIQVTARN